MHLTRRKFGLTLTAPLIYGMSGLSLAQEQYPGQPIRFILPFPAGSGTDMNARVLAVELTKRTHLPVIIDNRPGANGFIAAQAVAAAAPDGYTALVSTNTTHAANAALFKKLPYDPINDFEPVSILATAALILVVSASSPIQSFSQFLAVARGRERELTFGSGSSSTRIAAELLKQRTNARMLHVPYKGTPQALIDLIGGQVDFMTCDIVPAMPLIKAGKLRALAVTSHVRDPLFPEVPTVAESGLPGYRLTSWSGMWLPKHTPKPIVEKLAQLVRGAVQSDAVRDQVARLAATAVSSLSPEDFAKFVRAESVQWASIVRGAGIEPE